MSLTIGTNVTSLVAQRNLNQVNQKQDRTLQKLSSGSRIVSAKDDAAGLSISEKLRGHIRSTAQAARNANDGIGLLQTAEGGLNELTNIMIRLRELSVQAASDTTGEIGREFSDKEFQQLLQEVDRISGATEFNGRKLLNGEGEDADIQIGIDADPILSRISYNISESDVRTSSLGVDGLSINSKEGAQDSMGRIDTAIDMISSNRSTLGALQSRLNSMVRNLEISKENLSAANSQIRDADIASETTELTKNNILTSSSVSVLAQANTAPRSALKLIG